MFRFSLRLNQSPHLSFFDMIFNTLLQPVSLPFLSIPFYCEIILDTVLQPIYLPFPFFFFSFFIMRSFSTPASLLPRHAKWGRGAPHATVVHACQQEERSHPPADAAQHPVSNALSLFLWSSGVYFFCRFFFRFSFLIFTYGKCADVPTLHWAPLLVPSFLCYGKFLPDAAGGTGRRMLLDWNVCGRFQICVAIFRTLLVVCLRINRYFRNDFD